MIAQRGEASAKVRGRSTARSNQRVASRIGRSESRRASSEQKRGTGNYVDVVDVEAGQQLTRNGDWVTPEFEKQESNTWNRDEREIERVNSHGGGTEK